MISTINRVDPLYDLTVVRSSFFIWMFMRWLWAKSACFSLCHVWDVIKSVYGESAEHTCGVLVWRFGGWTSDVVSTVFDFDCARIQRNISFHRFALYYFLYMCFLDLIYFLDVWIQYILISPIHINNVQTPGAI